MELFLNLCWLSLLLPAFLLWRQRAILCSTGRGRRPLIFIATLGCALILLFPVISASDDLHAMRPEMEESERTCRDANRCSNSPHAIAHSSQSILVSSVSVSPVFEQMGTVLPVVLLRIGEFSAPAPAGRAPPLVRPVSL
jgi:hypothetical protein